MNPAFYIQILYVIGQAIERIYIVRNKIWGQL